MMSVEGFERGSGRSVRQHASWFDQFNIIEVGTKYSAGARGGQKPVSELVISNFVTPPV